MNPDFHVAEQRLQVADGVTVPDNPALLKMEEGSEITPQ